MKDNERQEIEKYVKKHEKRIINITINREIKKEGVSKPNVSLPLLKPMIKTFHSLIVLKKCLHIDIIWN